MSLDIPFYRTSPVRAASSTSRCNTIQCIDSTMLALENHLFGCTRSKPSQCSVPASLTLASDFGFYFQCQAVSSLVLRRPIEITAVTGEVRVVSWELRSPHTQDFRWSANRNIKKANRPSPLRTAWRAPHRRKSCSALADDTSRLALSSSLFVGKITTNVNGITANRSTPPSSQAASLPIHQEVKARREPTIVNDACMTVPRL